MKERAVVFGQNLNLLGIISEPESGERLNNVPAVIILNSGLLHKVGPFRLNTELSRKIAENGFIVLRFDLSGIGDSKLCLKEANRWERAIHDVRKAMDYMSESFGSKNFILIGLCSGSDNAHRVSLAENRVIGTVHLDGLSYKNYLYYLNYYGGRIICRKWLINKFCAIMDKYIFRKNLFYKKPTEPLMPYLDRDFPTKKKAISDFRILVSRGVKLLCVFTGGVENYNNYKNQLHDSLQDVNFQDFLELEYFLHAQHTYTTVNSRKKVINRIVMWIDQHFGSISSNGCILNSKSLLSSNSDTELKIINEQDTQKLPN
jgi:hypothetical protein